MTEFFELLMLLDTDAQIDCLNYLIHRDELTIERSTPMNKKKDIIDRIKKLTDEQFELLIYLYSQQEQEFAQDGQAVHLSSSLPA